MPENGEIRLAVYFALFLVAITILLTCLWWSANRDNRTVRWLFAADAAILTFCAGMFLEPVIGLVSATILTSAAIYCTFMFGYACLVQSVGIKVRFAVLFGYAIAACAVLAALAIIRPDEIGVLYVAHTLMLVPALLAMAWSIFSVVARVHNAALAYVLATPFAATALLFVIRLGALAFWPDPDRLAMLTGAIVLALGVDATAFLFALAHLRNNQDARALEQARHTAEAASEAKSDFLRTMSHELRTPLNAIIGFSELIRNERQSPDIGRFRNNAEHIHMSGRYLLGMIEDLLDLTSLTTGKVQLRDDRFDVAGMIVEVVHLIEGQAAERSIALQARHAEELVLLRADRRRILQVLVNLAGNAVKFTPDGGSIEIGYSGCDDGGIAFFVRDTGIGMSKDEIEVAFQLFGQNRRRSGGRSEGVGIGLPLARELAQLHGGEIEIDSAPDCGTTVWIRLPANRVILGKLREIGSVAA